MQFISEAWKFLWNISNCLQYNQNSSTSVAMHRSTHAQELCMQGGKDSPSSVSHSCWEASEFWIEELASPSNLTKKIILFHAPHPPRAYFITITNTGIYLLKHSELWEQINFPMYWENTSFKLYLNIPNIAIRYFKSLGIQKKIAEFTLVFNFHEKKMHNLLLPYSRWNGESVIKSLALSVKTNNSSNNNNNKIRKTKENPFLNAFFELTFYTLYIV